MKLIDPRSAAAFAHDVLVSGIAWTAAFWLRFNLEIPEIFFSAMTESLMWVVPLHVVAFWSLGLYRGIWRYASLPDLRQIVLAVGFATAAAALLVLLFQTPNIPRSVFVLHPMILVMLMGGSRLAYRAWKEGHLFGKRGTPVLVLGAGDAAADLMKNFARSPQWRVVGLLDDNAAKHGRQIQGVSVLGTLDELAEAAANLRVRHAIIAMPGESHQSRRRALELCARAGVEAMTVPSFDDIMSGKVTVSQLRKVELDDLLGRDPVQLDSAGLDGWIRGRVVMVTGAGGSIGSELCRQLARFGPELIVMFDHGEFALYEIEREFRERRGEARIVCLAGDVKNRARMMEAMSRYRPSIVFHAAAYKHVPLMEDLNAWEAVKNNALGTWRAASVAADCDVEKFVLVSTDKAVNPTNVMGASKRLAELLCRNLSGGNTRYVTVRFGNVLGSTGSVVPKFREQIAHGGPITVTHPEITRYFMSIPEAAQLVLQAGLMGQGGEIFVLDMGEPVKIADLARDMIRLSGLAEQDIRIEFTGLRPGEKLYEELLADGERTLPTPHPKLRVARAAPGLPAEAVSDLVQWLQNDAPVGDAEVRATLARFVPEYRPMRRGLP